ncbi:MAG: efflux RND transporter periplasmic adaptor subunit [Planctomycetota bacterium]
MKKVIGIAIWIIVLGSLAFGAYYLYQKSTAPAERSYRSAPVKRGLIVASISATGTVEPEEVVDIGAQVAGRINSFGVDKAGKQVDYGSFVEADQILAQIDASLYLSDLAQAKAQLSVDTAGVEKARADLETAKAKHEQSKSDAVQLTAKLEQAHADLRNVNAKVDQAKFDVQQAQAKLDQALRDWTRAQKLGPSDALSHESYDAFKGVYEAAVAGVNSSKSQIVQAESGVASQQAIINQAKANIESQKSVIAQAGAAILSVTAAIKQAEGTVAHDVAVVSRAQQNVDYCTIKAPVKGVIIDRRVNIGQTVVSSLNAPSLFLLAKDLTRMQVWVAMNEADIGQIKAGQPVTFTIDAFAGKSFKGSVRKVRYNATMTQNVVTYTIEVETDNSSGTLLPYMTANAQFEVARHDDVVMVPNSALRFNPKPDEIAPDVVPDDDKPSRGPMATTQESSSSKSDEPKKPADGDKPEVAEKKGPRSRGVSTKGKVWIQDGQFLRPIRVRVGITDGTNTEIKSDELKEDMQLIVGRIVQASSDVGTPSNPFVPQMGRRSGSNSTMPPGPPMR